MSLKLITLAALGAAAQASVADQIAATAMEARAIVASHTRRQLDSRFLATTPYMKAKCIKGYPSDMLTKSAGITLVVQTTGYCMNQPDGTSAKLTCDGTFLFYFTLSFFFLKFCFGCDQVTMVHGHGHPNHWFLNQWTRRDIHETNLSLFFIFHLNCLNFLRR